jgi:4-hydroxy-3-methylbut-2-enyl diphosphate reductase IspH
VEEGTTCFIPQVFDRWFLTIIETLDGIAEDSIVIIRSHGAPPSLYEQAKERGIHLVDATCQFVKKTHEKIMLLEKQGYLPVIIG